MISKSFPRGDKKLDKSSNTSFTKNKLQKKKTNWQTKFLNKSKETDETVLLNVAHNLKYSTLCEGMIILGRIFKITDYYAIVSLPGQISGKLKATDLCKSYTNLLKDIADNNMISDDFKTMSHIYKQGDYIICYVKGINFQTRKVFLSVEPQLINEKINLSFLTEHSKLVFTISSVEDHGYVLETGLKNVRAFLSAGDVEDNKLKLNIGKQVLGSIKDIRKDDQIFNALVSLRHSNHIESNGLPFDNFVPGTRLTLIVKKVLKNGLQVCFGTNEIGYVNQFYIEQALSHFEKGQKLIGTLIYTIPMIKLAYFSLLSQEKENKLVLLGDVIEAQTLTRDSKGIIVQLKKGIRGYIPLKRTEIDFKKLQSVFAFNSVHKCKVIGYDSIAKLYICSMEKKILKTNLSDLRTGNVVNVFITHIDKENGYLTVSSSVTGKILGTVPPDQIFDSGSGNDLKIGDNIKARVLDSSENIVFTLKKSLVHSKLPILCKFEDAKVNEIHHGSIIKISNQGVLVRFFDNVKGWIPKRFLNTRNTLKNWNLVLGETVTTVIKNVNTIENKIILALSNNDIKINIEIGDVVKGHMSPCLEVGRLLAAKTVAGDKLSVIVFSMKPNLIVSTTFTPEKTYNNISDLSSGDNVLCSVTNIYKESIQVLLPIKNLNKYEAVYINNVENIEAMYKNQMIFSKVVQAVGETQTINLTTNFSKIWKDLSPEVQTMGAVDVLCSYLNKTLELSKNIFYTSKPICKMNIGQRIKGTIVGVMSDGLVLKLEGNMKGIVRKDNFLETYKNGEQVEGSVLWINYPHEYIELSLLPTVMKSISIKQNKLAKIPIGVILRGEIVLVTNWFVLVILKGHSKGTLVTLPVRRHLNDIVPDLSPYQIGCKIRCYGILNKDDADILLPICILKSVFEVHNCMIEMSFKPSLESRKRKAQENVDHERCPILKKKKKIDIEDNVKNKKIASEVQQIHVKQEEWNKKYIGEQSKDEIISIDYKKKTEKKIQKQRDSLEENKTLDFSNLSISECGFDWNNLKSEQTIDRTSDTDIEAPNKNEKKKLTTTRRQDIEIIKKREVHEYEFASCNSSQTVHQFDKLVLSNPNNSLVYVQYMTYYLQVTEIEKARSIARRALKTICLREENEKLNIWKAWLNLELKFGTLESIKMVFQEALKTTNAERICLHMITLYLNAGNHAEIEKIVNMMVAKFKQNSDIWINCGEAMLKIGLKDKSRLIMQRALQSLPKHEHIGLIVKFATLESKFGDREHSKTLFESLLEKYKNRIDIWSSYVDSLVKFGEIELARKILERAINEIISIRKIKVLFKKYVSFEKKYGCENSVLHVQQLAAKYIEDQYNKVSHS
ncbi:protein RRP5 homolog isoform X2 [Phymastichus coffea]|uniref:protein RRP5 homolog isoform X2 n=1 Tax=Phymastichus coffea TaxID=108790 RepID=UPI00273C406F|nr:protein RRP5 homolog isoform X2 [Phymastichus coffea]